MGCTVRGSGTFALGPASATIDAGSQLTVDSVAGVTGTVTGKAKLGPPVGSGGHSLPTGDDAFPCGY